MKEDFNICAENKTENKKTDCRILRWKNVVYPYMHPIKHSTCAGRKNANLNMWKRTMNFQIYMLVCIFDRGGR